METRIQTERASWNVILSPYSTYMTIDIGLWPVIAHFVHRLVTVFTQITIILMFLILFVVYFNKLENVLFIYLFISLFISPHLYVSLDVMIQ